MPTPSAYSPRAVIVESRCCWNLPDGHRCPNQGQLYVWYWKAETDSPFVHYGHREGEKFREAWLCGYHLAILQAHPDLVFCWSSERMRFVHDKYAVKPVNDAQRPRSGSKIIDGRGSQPSGT